LALLSLDIDNSGKVGILPALQSIGKSKSLVLLDATPSLQKVEYKNNNQWMKFKIQNHRSNNQS